MATTPANSSVTAIVTTPQVGAPPAAIGASASRTSVLPGPSAAPTVSNAYHFIAPNDSQLTSYKNIPESSYLISKQRDRPSSGASLEESCHSLGIYRGVS